MPRHVLDYSFFEIQNLTELETLKPQMDENDEKKINDNNNKNENNDQIKYKAHSIRLSNNNITDLIPLYPTLNSIVQNMSELNWIDLSFNNITEIGDAFLELTNIRVIYLHANQITSLSQIKKLAHLNLRALTLHGNPVEDKKSYRNFIIYLLPTLTKLDFSAITRRDREIARAWGERFEKKMKSQNNN